jgi:hypothetical protein
MTGPNFLGFGTEELFMGELGFWLGAVKVVLF